MSEWLNKAFSGGVSLARVNPVGMILLVVGIVLIIAADPVSKRRPDEKRTKVRLGMKVFGLLVCALGAAVAIM